MHVAGIDGLPEIEAGDDLGGLLAGRIDPGPEDVVVIASTVVSKAEGRRTSLSAFPAGPRATEIAERLGALHGEEKDPRFAQAVLEEATEVIMEAPFLLTETRFGHIGVNAGIDRSNTGEDAADDGILLLPTRPTESAARIRAGIERETGVAPAVVVSDTSGRPFRYGQRGVAIGWAGIPAARDWRGETDRDGYELGVTVEAVVDELAAAANLVMGEGDGGTPAVHVTEWAFGEHDGHEPLFRSVRSDYVRQALREWTYHPPEDDD